MSRLTDMLKGLVPHTQADPAGLSNAEIAELLQTSPEALAAFTSAYRSFEEVRPESEYFFTAAIIALDEVEERIFSGVPFHSLHVQMLVEVAKNEYAQSLAILMRWHAPNAVAVPLQS